MAALVVDGGVRDVIELDGDGAARFGFSAGAEELEFYVLTQAITGAYFVLVEVEETQGVFIGGFTGEAPIEVVVGIVKGILVGGNLGETVVNVVDKALSAVRRDDGD